MSEQGRFHDVAEQIVHLLDELEGSPGPRRPHLLAASLYRADARVGFYVAAVRAAREQAATEPDPKMRQELRQRAGYLMEVVAQLAFESLRGVEAIKSYQSAGPQLDLLVSGSDAHWRILLSLLGLTSDRPKLLVEAKATNEKIDHPTFMRLCGIINNHFETRVGLGVFFTISGASSFPRKGDSPKRGVNGSQLEQLLFHARTRVPVVVLDEDDLSILSADGGLVLLLKAKIDEVSEKTGRSISVPEVPVEHFPAHLREIPHDPSALKLPRKRKN